MKKTANLKNLISFAEGINKLLDDIQFKAKASETIYWAPSVDIFCTPTAYILQADLPDVLPEDISVTTQGNILKISGSREIIRHAKKYYQLERPAGTFCRTFTLSETADIDRIDAVMTDGVLTITIPIKQTHDIKVEINSYEEKDEHKNH